MMMCIGVMALKATVPVEIYGIIKTTVLDVTVLIGVTALNATVPVEIYGIIGSTVLEGRPKECG
jgi:hypothetical protein